MNLGFRCQKEKIAIFVPVYNGIEFLQEAFLKKIKTNYSLIGKCKNFVEILDIFLILFIFLFYYVL